MLCVVSIIFYAGNVQNDRSEAQVVNRPPYDPLALFNTPIPNNYPADSRSSSIISKWTSVMGNNSGIFFSIDGEVPPLNKSRNSDPLYSFSAGISGTFRVNTGAVTGSGSDHPTIILNTDTLQELRIWQANINHGSKTISGSNGSLFYYNNDGSIKNPNGTRSLSIPYSGGGAGNGLSYHAGMITRADWDSGVIRHVLRIAYNNCSFNGNTYRTPATKSDQPKGCTSAGSSVGMDMGMILQLSNSVNCDTRTSPTGKANDNKFVRMVCHAMQDYGVMVSDGTGASAVFYMEANGTSGFSNILTTSNGHLGNHFRNPSGTNGVPWNQFRVVAKPVSNTNWGAGIPVTPPPGPAPTPQPSPSPTPSTKPASPSGLALTPGDHKLVAKWNTSPVSEGVDSYQVYLNGSYSYSTTATPSYTITGTPGETYNVRVSAHNVYGYGPWTSSVSGVIGSSPGVPAPAPTPVPSPPQPPPPISVPGSNTSNPVPIPIELPRQEDGSIIADFTGDGLNEVAKDENNDGQIDPNTEIVIDGKMNNELTDVTRAPVTIAEYMELLNGERFSTDAGDSSVVKFKPSPLPEVRIPKPVAYTFLIAGGLTLTGIGTYLAVIKLALFAGLRGRLGL